MMYKLLLTVKNILIKILGIRTYLKFISRSYFFLEKIKLLKYFGQELQDVFHLHKFIRPGYVCIDIGANLGYYTVPMSRLAGKEGAVIAVEPVPVFAERLRSNVKALAHDNVTIHNFALGENEGETLQMGTPVVEGIYRHGFTKVVEDDGFEYSELYEVEVKTPASLFSNLERIDFLKCDVEGYEHHIIPLMYSLIDKFRPVILIEFGSPENRRSITGRLTDSGYEVYSVTARELRRMDNPADYSSETNNFFFIHKIRNVY